MKLLLAAALACAAWEAGNKVASMDDLTAARDKAFLEQLCGRAIEQHLSARFADAVLECPDGGAIGEVGALASPQKRL